MNRYIKVNGHNNWFLVLDKDSIIDYIELSNNMQEKLLRSEVCALHSENDRGDELHRLKYLAAREIDYKKIVDRCSCIIVRPSGSYMLLNGNEIVEEVFDNDFPIDNYGEVVICENDNESEYKWREYLLNRFPDKKIVTINFFDLRSENEVTKFFEKAKYITFSTTFSNLEWYHKLLRNINETHKVIGYCHDMSKWDGVVKMYSNVEIVDSI